ncbi:hypothetical protein APSETT444_001417 [Aspergillus pseudonomiae]
MDQVTLPRTPKDNGAIDSEESASTHASSQILANNDKAGFGDFVSTDYEEFELEEVVEPWDKYDPKSTPNVFYPICLGEVLNERYLIEHKIDAVMKFAMDTRMSAAKQLLEALETLQNAGILHRDLNVRNCMWEMAPLQNLSRSAKYEALTRPLQQTIPAVELWKPGELVRPMQVPENLRTEDFYLGDFGLAMKVGDPVDQPGYPPMQFCSPERLHGKDPSFACDMWSYMINFAALYQGQPPFNPWYRGGVLTTITGFLGPLPEQWKDSYVFADGLDSWYDRNQTPDTKRTLASELARYRPDADPAVRELVLSIMQKVFIYSPEKRLTATQLLADPSFKALMARFGC